MDALTASNTFVELFPYMASVTGGLLTIFVGLLLRNQSKTQDYQTEVQKTLTFQSQQLTKLTVLIENVITDKLPGIEKRLEKLEDKFNG
jgi:hypothetical protein